MLCVISATVFWFFNSLNKEHTATISYPVAFSYDRAQFISVKQLPEHVALNITGSGWDLLRKSLGFKISPLQISLEKPVETHKIPPSSILPLALAQMGQTKINHVGSDTLFLQIEPRRSKTIRLAINPRRLRFELGFGLSSEIKLSPDSVLIEGPQSFIEQVSDTLVLPFTPGRISQNVKAELDIHDKSDETIQVKPATAIVSFEVDELKDVTMPIRIVVLPASPYRFQISTDSTRIVLRMPKKSKDSLKDAIGLVGLIDLRNLAPGVSKVSPSVKGLPMFAELLKVDSVTIRKY